MAAVQAWGSVHGRREATATHHMEDGPALITTLLDRDNRATSYGFTAARLDDGRHVVKDVSGLPALGKLEVGDEIVQLNGISTDHLSHATVCRIICRHTSAKIVLKRVPRAADEMDGRVVQSTEGIGSSRPNLAKAFREKRRIKHGPLISETDTDQVETTPLPGAMQSAPPKPPRGVANGLSSADRIVPAPRQPPKERTELPLSLSPQHRKRPEPSSSQRSPSFRERREKRAQLQADSSPKTAPAVSRPSSTLVAPGAPADRSAVSPVILGPRDSHSLKAPGDSAAVPATASSASQPAAAAVPAAARSRLSPGLLEARPTLAESVAQRQEDEIALASAAAASLSRRGLEERTVAPPQDKPAGVATSRETPSNAGPARDQPSSGAGVEEKMSEGISEAEETGFRPEATPAEGEFASSDPPAIAKEEPAPPHKPAIVGEQATAVASSSSSESELETDPGPAQAALADGAQVLADTAAAAALAEGERVLASTEPLPFRGPRTLTLSRQNGGSFGFTLIGSEDESRFPDEQSGCFVIEASGERARDAGLARGDKLLEIDGEDVSEEGIATVAELLSRAGNDVTVVVEQEAEGAREMRSELEQGRALARCVTLTGVAAYGLGLTVVGSSTPGPLFVAEVHQDGLLARQALIRAGDQILAVDNDDTTIVTNSHAQEILSAVDDRVCLVLLHNPAGWDRYQSMGWGQTAPKDNPAFRPGFPYARSTTVGNVKRLTIARERGNLGFEVVGGCDSHFGAIFVHKIATPSPAERAGLKAGDRILFVDGASLISADHDTAVEAMVGTGPSFGVTVQRLGHVQWTALVAEVNALSEARKAAKLGPPPRWTREAMLPLLPATAKRASRRFYTSGPVETFTVERQSGSLGMGIVGGSDTAFGAVFVSAITPGGSADVDGNMEAGDRLLAINGHSVMFRTRQEVTEALSADGGGQLTFSVLRSGLDQYTAIRGDVRLGFDSRRPTVGTRTGGTFDVTLTRQSMADTFGVRLGRTAAPLPRHIILETKPDSPAASLLAANDVLLAVNGSPVSELSKAVVSDLFRDPLEVLLTVQRTPLASVQKASDSAAAADTVYVLLERTSPHEPLGFGIGEPKTGRMRQVVHSVRSTGLSTGKLFEGDELAAINGRATEGCSHQEVLELLAGQTRLVLAVRRRRPPVSAEPSGLQQQTRRGEPQAKEAATTTAKLDAAANPAAREVLLTRPSASEPFGFAVAETVAAPPVHIVHEVVPGGHADASGLRPGDEITAVGGKPAASLTQQQVLSEFMGRSHVLLHVLSHEAPGIRPNQSPRGADVPSAASAPAAVTATTPSLHTVTLRRPNVSAHFGIAIGETDEPVGRFVVVGVDQAVSDAAARLLPDDVIVGCNGVAVAQMSFDELLRAVAGSVVLELEVQRSAPVASVSVALAPEEMAVAPSSGPILHIPAAGCDDTVLVGGMDTSYGGVYVKSSPAASELRSGDRILAVGTESLLEATADHALVTLLAAEKAAAEEAAAGEAKSVARVSVIRLGDSQWPRLSAACQGRPQEGNYLRPISCHWHMMDGSFCAATGPVVVCEHRKVNGKLGVTVTGGVDTSLSGVFVSKTSPAAQEATRGSLRVGDKLLAVDGRSLLQETQAGAGEQLQKTGDVVRFVVLRLGDHQWRAVSAQAEAGQAMKTKSRPVSLGYLDDAALLKITLNREELDQPLGMMMEPDGRTIKAIAPGGLADGKLRPGDEIVEVDGGIVTDMRAADARALLRRKSSKLCLSVKRLNSLTVHIERPAGRLLGLHIGATKESPPRHIVHKCVPGSLAEGRLRPDDEVVSVNGTRTEGKSHEDVLALFAGGGDVVIDIVRNVNGKEDKEDKEEEEEKEDKEDKEEEDKEDGRASENAVAASKGAADATDTTSTALLPYLAAIEREDLLGQVLGVSLQKDRGRLGLSLIGGFDTAAKGVFVKLADHRHQEALRVGDQLLEVDGRNVVTLPREGIESIIGACGPVVSMVIFRYPKSASSFKKSASLKGLPKRSATVSVEIPGHSLATLSLFRLQHQDLGRVVACRADRGLQPGDRLLDVNGVNLIHEDIDHAAAALRAAQPPLRVTVLRMKDTIRKKAFSIKKMPANVATGKLVGLAADASSTSSSATSPSRRSSSPVGAEPVVPVVPATVMPDARASATPGPSSPQAARRNSGEGQMRVDDDSKAPAGGEVVDGEAAEAAPEPETVPGIVVHPVEPLRASGAASGPVKQPEGASDVRAARPASMAAATANPAATQTVLPSHDGLLRIIVSPSVGKGYGLAVQASRTTPGTVSVSKAALDGQAYAAGVRQGDVLLEINGRDCRAATRDQAIDAIKSQPRMMLLIERAPPPSASDRGQSPLRSGLESEQEQRDLPKRGLAEGSGPTANKADSKVLVPSAEPGPLQADPANATVVDFSVPPSSQGAGDVTDTSQSSEDEEPLLMAAPSVTTAQDSSTSETIGSVTVAPADVVSGSSSSSSDEQPDNTYEVYMERGETGFGFGIKVDARVPSQAYVGKVTPGGAAEKAGISHGDAILSLNGVDCTEITRAEAVEATKLRPNMHLELERV